MPVQNTSTGHVRFRLSVWRIVTWVVVLLAAFGIFEYCVHAWHVAAGLRAATTDDAKTGLTRMLAWDIAYLAGACITVTAAAGALLRRGWARPVLRIVAVLLALWLLISGIMLAEDLMDFSRRSRMLLAQPGVGDAGRELVTHARRSFLVAIALKAAGVLVLAWLAWRLGTPVVRAEFPASPPRRAR